MRALALIFLLVSSAAAETSYFAFPGAGYLQGVGPIGGGVVGAKNVFGTKAKIVAGKTFGEADAAALGVVDVPFFHERASLAAGFGLLTGADFLTSYGRGFGEGLIVRQVMKGNGLGLRLNFAAVPGRLDLYTAESFSALKFVEYKTKDGDVIPMRMNDLHDVETLTVSVGAKAQAFETPERLALDLRLTEVKGRVAQSDLRILNIKAKGLERVHPRVSIGYVAAFNRAMVPSPVGTGSVNGACNTIADAARRADCVRLSSEITDFVRQSNRVGTLPPLGGARGLRSYREMRFKAANTSLAGVELGLKPSADCSLEVVSFYELGFASDHLAGLYGRSRQSVGVGLRIRVGGVPVRAEFAHGHEGNAGYLTVGLPW